MDWMLTLPLEWGLKLSLSMVACSRRHGRGQECGSSPRTSPRAVSQGECYGVHVRVKNCRTPKAGVTDELLSLRNLRPRYIQHIVVFFKVSRMRTLERRPRLGPMSTP